MTDNQLNAIHNATLELLATTGVQVNQDESIELLRSAGAIVKENNIVQIPEALVKRALSTVPSRIVMSNRDGKRCMFLEPGRSYFGTGSGCPNIIDPFTGERRRTTREDVANEARLCDSLPNIDFVMSLGLVEHEDPDLGYIYEFEAMARNTKKPIIASCSDGQNAQDIINMAAAIMGGHNQLREKTLIAIYSEATAPLRHAEDALEKLLVCAKNWIPVIHTIGSLAGATAPVTLAGALATGNAEVLSALVIHQLKQPGAPFFHGGTITPIDMKTMVHPYGAPEFHVLSACLTEMGRYYNMPVFSTGGCSDAKLFDEQASAEAAYSLLLEALSGGNLIHDIGYVDSGLTADFSMVYFSDEMIGLIKHVISPVPVGDEELALEAVHRVGPGGHFLSDPHTLKHFRSIYSPKLFVRDRYELWEEKGSESLGNTIRKRVIDVLENYDSEQFSEQIGEDFCRLIKEIEDRKKA
ncbi:MAG: trimethylamine methyltransferase [Firmicutes bacterium]|nr:trimethylamine methyltransferase [Bacillota bacterium]